MEEVEEHWKSLGIIVASPAGLYLDWFISVKWPDMQLAEDLMSKDGPTLAEGFGLEGVRDDMKQMVEFMSRADLRVRFVNGYGKIVIMDSDVEIAPELFLGVVKRNPAKYLREDVRTMVADYVEETYGADARG